MPARQYLCSRRQPNDAAGGRLFTSPEVEELRIYAWSKRTEDGSLSDFEIEPDAKVVTRLLERGLCSRRFVAMHRVREENGICFFNAAEILSADVRC